VPCVRVVVHVLDVAGRWAAHLAHNTPSTPEGGGGMPASAPAHRQRGWQVCCLQHSGSAPWLSPAVCGTLPKGVQRVGSQLSQILGCC
jgi:hypothetical protein